MRESSGYKFFYALTLLSISVAFFHILFFYNISASFLLEPTEQNIKKATIEFAFLAVTTSITVIFLVIFLARYFTSKEIREFIKLKHRFESMNESIGEGVLALNNSGSIIYANKAAEKLLGYTKSEMLGQNAHELIHYETKDGRFVPKDECHVLKSLEKDGSCSSEDDVYIRKDGLKIDVFFVATPLLIDGKNEGSMLIFSDITEKKQNIKKLLLSDAIVKNIKEGVIVTDSHSNIIFTNPYFENITGYTSSELVGKKPSALKSGMHDAKFYEDMWLRLRMNGYWQGEIWNRKKDGKPYAEWLNITVVNADNSGKEKFYVAIFSDITERKLLEDELSKEREQLRHLASYDELTQIYNRQKFEEVLKIEFDRGARHGSVFSLIMLDIDNFKHINDTYGHQIGDTVLKEIASVVKNNIRKIDMVCRWGGEEFLILAPQTDIKGATSIAQNLRELIEEHPFVKVGRVTASFGVAGLEVGDNRDSILNRVDEALYLSKKEGKNRVTLL